MDNKAVFNKVAELETKCDHLETELSHLNELLHRCGFPEGTRSLINSIENLLQEESDS